MIAISQKIVKFGEIVRQRRFNVKSQFSVKVIRQPRKIPQKSVVSADHLSGLPFDACGSRFLMSVYISTPQWAAANRDTIKRFQGAMSKTAAWANKNHDKTAVMLTEYAKLPEATVRTMRRAPFAEAWNTAEAQPLIDLTAKYSNFPTFPAADMYVRTT